ncbi:hypothetical protein H2248_010396 [Termitomyces sp. 'cryptogamus']|nr:hypothetical protein H2248_010396 [Termitomyces sp. 'cryptogamus']
MRQTPWTRNPAPSSFPSDRLRPKPSLAPSRSKNSQLNQEPAPPQSKALRLLNELCISLRDPSTSTTPDPTGGCFCQARTHPLSRYVPICTACALPLCDLVAPAHLCPSCKEPLLTLNQRSDLITRIETEIADTTLREQLARERAEEERRAAAGAFPSLQSYNSAYPPPPSSSHRPAPPPEPQTYKVLSIGSKTKRTMLTTTTTRPQASVTLSTRDSRPSSPQPVREPRPDVNLGKGKARVDPVRPWANLNGDSAIYLPPARSVDEAEADPERKAGTRKRRRGKGKGKEKEKEEEGEEKENMQVQIIGGGGQASGS